MRQALALGARGLGRVWPNPSVGCVIVKDGRVIGRGVTAPGGRPHAEPIALAQAGGAAKGATVYVTLEPCAHFGRTAPCCDALIRAGVRRVVIALPDPDPRTNGTGAARLADAGITVETGVLADQARLDHAGFLSRIERKRPFVTLKLAISMDGRIATSTGQSKWITGPLARRQVHLMRARHDAVMVGGGTARADNPSLTVRDLGIAHQPVRVVMSRGLDIALDGALATGAQDGRLWLFHGQTGVPADIQAAWRARGAQLHPVAVGARGHLDPLAVLQSLSDQGITRVFCEGGAALAADLLRADLVDDLVIFSAGLALGADAIPAIGAMGVAQLTQAPAFGLHDTRRIGDDVMQIWRKATP
jgi:diaminohydroxyphosphoribosylaminopyrimidine deaminase/5-amino-6-(5-phosphoribosylamino)uracil reductase